MLNIELDEGTAVCTLTPSGKLQVEDFSKVGTIIDPFIEQHGDMVGLMIAAESFPGWADFSALTAHLKFVREHQKHVRKIAIVSDANILSIMPSLANHFVKAEVKHFDFSEKAQALAWLNQ